MDYYQLLGVSRVATEAEIKSAYRKLAFAYHPDRNPGDKAAEARFKQIQLAYETLIDVNARARYNSGHAQPKRPQPPPRKPKGSTEFKVRRDGFGISDAPPPVTDLWGNPLSAFERAEWARNNATDIKNINGQVNQGWKDSMEGKYSGGSPELR